MKQTEGTTPRPCFGGSPQGRPIRLPPCWRRQGPTISSTWGPQLLCPTLCSLALFSHFAFAASNFIGFVLRLLLLLLRYQHRGCSFMRP